MWLCDFRKLVRNSAEGCGEHSQVCTNRLLCFRYFLHLNVQVFNLHLHGLPSFNCSSTGELRLLKLEQTQIQKKMYQIRISLHQLVARFFQLILVPVIRAECPCGSLCRKNMYFGPAFFRL